MTATKSGRKPMSIEREIQRELKDVARTSIRAAVLHPNRYKT
jgi:hypothetical protein